MFSRSAYEREQAEARARLRRSAIAAANEIGHPEAEALADYMQSLADFMVEYVESGRGDAVDAARALARRLNLA